MPSLPKCLLMVAVGPILAASTDFKALAFMAGVGCGIWVLLALCAAEERGWF